MGWQAVDSVETHTSLPRGRMRVKRGTRFEKNPRSEETKVDRFSAAASVGSSMRSFCQQPGCTQVCMNQPSSPAPPHRRHQPLRGAKESAEANAGVSSAPLTMKDRRLSPPRVRCQSRSTTIWPLLASVRGENGKASAWRRAPSSCTMLGAGSRFWRKGARLRRPSDPAQERGLQLRDDPEVPANSGKRILCGVVARSGSSPPPPPPLQSLSMLLLL